MWDSSTWVESRIKSLMSLRSWRNIHHIQQCGVCKSPSAWSALLRKNVTCSLSNQYNSLLFPKKVAIWIFHFVKYMNKHQLESFLFQCFFSSDQTEPSIGACFIHMYTDSRHFFISIIQCIIHKRLTYSWDAQNLTYVLFNYPLEKRASKT